MVRFIRQRTDSGGKNFWFRKKRGRYGKCHTLHGKLCKDTVFIKGAGYPYYDDRGALLLYPGKYLFNGKGTDCRRTYKMAAGGM